MEIRLDRDLIPAQHGCSPVLKWMSPTTAHTILFCCPSCTAAIAFALITELGRNPAHLELGSRPAITAFLVPACRLFDRAPLLIAKSADTDPPLSGCADCALRIVIATFSARIASLRR